MNANRQKIPAGFNHLCLEKSWIGSEAADMEVSVTISASRPKKPWGLISRIMMKIVTAMASLAAPGRSTGNAP